MKLNSKSNKPYNILIKENQLEMDCKKIERSLPNFLFDYFIFLIGSVSVTTRFAYLNDIHFFFEYLVEEKIVKASRISDITIKMIDNLKARDLNYFIGEYCRKYSKIENDLTVIYENDTRSLSRKKSSLASLFKFLYRNDQIRENIVDGLNPIKLPKLNPDAIKRLSIDETNELIKIVNTGYGLTKKEYEFWQKTRYRDKAIIMVFIVLGLRLSELEHLNLSSFNFKRREFTVFRKRGREVIMPYNEQVEKALMDYINLERNSIPLIDDGDPLFLSLQGKRLTGRQIREIIKKYTSLVLGTSHGKGFSPHKLRATLASSLIETGYSIYDVQNLLDHDNVTTTQIYAAHRKNVKKSIIESMSYLEDEE